MLLLASACSALAEVHYVDANSTNATAPYTNWATAATHIQDAVDAAVTGEEIVVTNGLYDSGSRSNASGFSRVIVEKPLALRSVNGPGATTIVGSTSSSRVRCVYLTDGASLSGFTLTNGLAPWGGGVLCGSMTVVVSNCVLTGNYASSVGGGAYGGTLSTCTLINNETGEGGGGAAWSMLNNCRLIDNSAGGINSDISGGGALSCTLNNCLVTGNSANAITGFVLESAYGGGAYDSTLNNCTLTGNSANMLYYGFGSAYGGGASYCTLNNCTLTGNSANIGINGLSPAYGGGASHCTLRNCIVYFNSCDCGLSYDQDLDASNTSWCWTADPLFVNRTSANLRLQSNSPCINSGNNAYAPAGPDLDGNPRIVGGTVDIGAYEFQSPVSQISYAWLQQYGLPINSSTDTADPDGDGVDNYHEWLAGTDPTSPLSSPAQLTITPSGIPPGVIVLTWSTNAVGFTLQSTTNPLSSSAWATNSPVPVVVNGQNVVTNSLTGAQQFYRLIH